MNATMTKQQLTQKQAMSLEQKIDMSKRRIRSFYEAMRGNVYISFSGGKDSTVLLHLIRSIYPDMKAVFIDTGLEYPEIREFVRTIDNVEIVRPKMTFLQVIKKYGYPCISKEQAMYIRQYRTTKSEYLKKVRWEGKNKRFKISEKWKFLVNAPFMVSEKCCDVLKKRPIESYNRKNKVRPFLGTMASDSLVRERMYLRNGCSVLKEGKEKSMPMSFWLEEDVWAYIKKFNLKYSTAYDKGLDRTGCIFCLFGCHLEKNDRFEILKKIHPELYDYCMNTLKVREVIDYIKGEGEGRYAVSPSEVSKNG